MNEQFENFLNARILLEFKKFQQYAWSFGRFNADIGLLCNETKLDIIHCMARTKTFELSLNLNVLKYKQTEQEKSKISSIPPTCIRIHAEQLFPLGSCSFAKIPQFQLSLLKHEKMKDCKSIYMHTRKSAWTLCLAAF